MKLWMSGRIDHDINDEIFRKALNTVEKSINYFLDASDYGNLIESWDVVMVIFADAQKGYCRYNAKSKETDIEIIIDHEQFKNGTLADCMKLFYEGLITSLIKLSENPKLNNFNFQSLINQVMKIKEQH
jgi:hypothetical protein